MLDERRIAAWIPVTGADTVLAQEPVLAQAPRPGPNTDGPLLAVVDGRGRVTAWQALRDAGYWSGVVALRARGTRPIRDAAVEEIVTGEDRVDLAEALTELGRRGARVVRVDSGGGLTGALLAAQLVDEISLLIHPVVAGTDHRWHGAAPLPQIPLQLDDCRRLEGDDGVVWLRYDVPRRTSRDASP
jgi:2,5-diamino-6-(ribosylamino)-4(3H)-pyrimidinone 5'-phosphate reductase